MNDEDASTPVMVRADGLLSRPRARSEQSLTLIRHKGLGRAAANDAILVSFAACADKGLYHLG